MKPAAHLLATTARWVWLCLRLTALAVWAVARACWRPIQQRRQTPSYPKGYGPQISQWTYDELANRDHTARYLLWLVSRTTEPRDLAHVLGDAGKDWRTDAVHVLRLVDQAATVPDETFSVWALRVQDAYRRKPVEFPT